MRIAVVIQHYPPYVAGSERQAELLARTFARECGACDVVTTRFRPNLPARSADGGVTIRRLPTPRARSLKVIVNALVAFAYFLVRGRRYTHAHVNNLSPFSLGAMAALRLWRRPIVLKIGSVGPKGDIAKARRHPLGGSIWRLFGSADAFIAPSPIVEQELHVNGVPADRIVTVPNALAPEWFEPTTPASRVSERAALGLPDSLLVLFVGRLTVEKGVRRLVDAWVEVAPRVEGTLVLVGEGPERTWIERRARAAGLGDRVLMVGNVEDARAYFRIADIFAFASQSESFGNVIVEAMASGLAIVCTRVGIGESVLRDGQNALTVEQDTGQLADCILGLARDADRRRRFGDAARREARSRFDIGAVAPRYRDLFASLDRAIPRTPANALER